MWLLANSALADEPEVLSSGQCCVRERGEGWKGGRRKVDMMRLNSASRASRSIFPDLEGIAHCFSSRKVLLIRSAGVIATYKIYLRTSLFAFTVLSFTLYDRYF